MKQYTYNQNTYILKELDLYIKRENNTMAYLETLEYGLDDKEIMREIIRISKTNPVLRMKTLRHVEHRF